MLPWQKPRAVAGLIIAKRKPDGAPEEQHMEGEENQGLESAAEALIAAVHAKDAKAVAAALRDAYEICESYEESPADEAAPESDSE